MMSTSETPDFESARSALAQLCDKVRLHPALLPAMSAAGVRPPKQSFLWAGDYACVLLWPISETDSAAVRVTALSAQGWFDELLSARERDGDGRTVDGYLVLALPTEPNADLKDEIRRIELSPQVCRKHLIWPGGRNDGDGGVAWLRVADVTVLGLPEAITATSGELHWPDLDKEAAEVWAQISRLGAAAAVEADAT
jgi:hypothetical protein